MNSGFKEGVQGGRDCLILILVTGVANDMTAISQGIVEKHQPDMIGPKGIRDPFCRPVQQRVDMPVVMNDLRCR